MAFTCSLRPPARAGQQVSKAAWRPLLRPQGFVRRSVLWQPHLPPQAPPSASSSGDGDLQQQAAAQPPPSAAVGPEAQRPAGGDATPAAAPGAAPAAEPPLWQRLLRGSASKVAAHLWPLVLVHVLCDSAVFALHRVSHRLTNEAAVAALGGGITPAAIGNMWWLSADPSIANFQTGYQALTIAVFLAAFPLNVLLKTWASAATILVCSGGAEAEGEGERLPWWSAVAGLRAAAGALAALRPRLAQVWRRLFLVELAVAAAVVPLQFASLAVVTLPLTLPLILGLQAAAPAAVLEGVSGLAAIRRSWELVKPIRWQLAGPFVGLVVVQRLLEAGKGWLLTSMPPRYYRELVEIPLLVLLSGTVVAVLLSRLQDVLPFVAYTEAVSEAKSSSGGSGSGGDGAVAGAAA